MVYRDNIFVPVANRAISLEVLDAFATPKPKTLLEFGSQVTGSNGYISEPVTFSSADIGVYKIVVRYSDGPLKNLAISENIIVFPGR